MLRRWLGPLVGFLVMLLAAMDGRAQTCNQTYTSSTSIATINTNLNNTGTTPDGSVVCLARGNTWTTSSGVGLTVSHPNTGRVTVCASSGGICSDSGGANPRLSFTSDDASCIDFNGNDGWTFKNIDCYASASSNVTAIITDSGAQNITIEGGVINGFWRGFLTIGTSPTNAVFGVPGNWIEVTGGPDASPGGDRHVWFGGCIQCSISVNVHHFYAYKSNDQDHMLDIAPNSGASDDWDFNNHDVTVTHSRFDTGGGDMGCLIKINRGYNMKILHSEFLATEGGNVPPSYICFGGHAAAGTEGVSCPGAPGGGSTGQYCNQIAYNTFDLSNSGAITSELAQEVDVFNNKVRIANGGNDRGFVQFWRSGDVENLRNQFWRIRNNTVVRTGNVGGYPVLVSENPGGTACYSGYPNGNTLANNLVIVADQVSPVITSDSCTGCNAYGASGANMIGNFLYYVPGSGTPSLMSCASDDDWNKSGTNPATADGFNVAPGVANLSAFDLSVTGSSKVCAVGGDASLTPSTDFSGSTRTLTCIGAFDVTSGGGSAPQNRGTPGGGGGFTIGALDYLRDFRKFRAAINAAPMKSRPARVGSGTTEMRNHTPSFGGTMGAIASSPPASR